MIVALIVYLVLATLSVIGGASARGRRMMNDKANKMHVMIIESRRPALVVWSAIVGPFEILIHVLRVFTVSLPNWLFTRDTGGICLCSNCMTAERREAFAQALAARDAELGLRSRFGRLLKRVLDRVRGH